MRVSGSGLILALFVALAGCSGERELAPRKAVFDTAPLPIDQIYHSMQGPFDRVPVAFDEMDWVTRFRTEVVDTDTGEPMGEEFFCHSQLQLLNSTRLLVGATGASDIRFPPGFAMPVTEILGALPADQRELSFLGMVLNNHEPDIDRQGTVRATIEYFRDSDLPPETEMRRLYIANLTMFVEDAEEYVPEGDVNEDVTTHCVLVSGPAHWVVPPGPQRTRRLYGKGTFPEDGTVHYGWVHMHNGGVYLQLTDTTTGTVLWRAEVENEPDRLQIARIDHYSSVEGFPIFKDHEYEIEAYYENPTDEDLDAMAMMSLYYEPVKDVAIGYGR